MESAFVSENQRICFTPAGVRHTVGEMGESAPGSSKIDLEEAVHLHYKAIYHFALHLAKEPNDAADLTQYAYARLAEKQDQVADTAKVKAWLHSTLYRKFIDEKRKVIRFPHVQFDEEIATPDRPDTHTATRIDAKAAVKALGELDESLRAPLSLFYLRSHSYKEIARILDLPVGTVMSRLHRGKEKLYQLLTKESK